MSSNKVSSTLPRFEPVIIPLIGVDPLDRPAPGKPGPIPGLLHCAKAKGGKLLIYVPGGVSGAPISGRHDYNTLAAELDAIGYSLLVLQMATAQRPIFLRFETCLNDIAPALAWAGEQGFDECSLAGNGLGAARIMLWCAANPDAEIKSLLLLSAMESPHLAIRRSGSAQQEQAWDERLSACRALVASGRGQDVVEVALPDGHRAMAAEIVLNYFGAPNEAKTTVVDFAAKLAWPVCLVHGDADGLAPPDGAAALLAQMTKAARKQLVWIEGGGHELLVEPEATKSVCVEIREWLGSL